MVFGIGNLIGKVVGAFVDGIFSLFEAIANAIVGPVKDQIAEPFLATLLYTPTPKYCPSGNSVQSCANPKPALLTKPENNPWGEIWDLYWGKFFVAALFIGLTLYIMTNFISSIPWVSPQLRERLRGGYLKLLVLLPMGWPIVAIVLFLMDAMNHLIAPDPERFAFLLSSIITNMVAAAASPFAIVTSLLSLVDILLLLTAFALFFFRIAFLAVVVLISPLLIMGLTLDIPLAKDIGKTLYSQWVKIGIAPMAVAGCYKVTALMITSPNGSGGYTYDGLGIWGNTGQIISLMLGMVIPLVGLLGFYFVLQATMPAGAGRALNSIQYRTPRKTVDAGEHYNEGKQWAKEKGQGVATGAFHKYRDIRMGELDDNSDLPVTSSSYPKGQAGDNKGPGWRDNPETASTDTDQKVAAALHAGPVGSHESGETAALGREEGNSDSRFDTEIIEVGGEETEVIDVGTGGSNNFSPDMGLEDENIVEKEGLSYVPSAHSGGIEKPVEGDDGVEFERKETEWSDESRSASPATEDSVGSTRHQSDNNLQDDTESGSDGSRRSSEKKTDAVSSTINSASNSENGDVADRNDSDQADSTDASDEIHPGTSESIANEEATPADDDASDTSNSGDSSETRSVLDIEGNGDFEITDESISAELEDDTITAELDDESVSAELDEDDVSVDVEESENRKNVLLDENEFDVDKTSEGGED